MLPGRGSNEDEAVDKKAPLLFCPCNIYSDVSHTAEVKHTIMFPLQSLKSDFVFSDFFWTANFYLLNLKNPKSLLEDYPHQ